jgi:hypothetical protein
MTVEVYSTMFLGEKDLGSISAKLRHKSVVLIKEH